MGVRDRGSIQSQGKGTGLVGCLFVSKPAKVAHARLLALAHSLTLVFRSTHSWHDSVGLFRFCFFLDGPLS